MERRKGQCHVPPNVDPCGEHGEYHSFVYAGPIFKKTIACQAAEMSLRAARFNYCDIVPGSPT
jgi:diphthamide synthase (EF-2-diphthine--ammonia ligase)